jgi:hypothetical protein
VRGLVLGGVRLVLAHVGGFAFGGEGGDGGLGFQRRLDVMSLFDDSGFGNDGRSKLAGAVNGVGGVVGLGVVGRGGLSDNYVSRSVLVRAVRRVAGVLGVGRLRVMGVADVGETAFDALKNGTRAAEVVVVRLGVVGRAGRGTRRAGWGRGGVVFTEVLALFYVDRRDDGVVVVVMILVMAVVPFLDRLNGVKRVVMVGSAVRSVAFRSALFRD